MIGGDLVEIFGGKDSSLLCVFIVELFVGDAGKWLGAAVRKWIGKGWEMGGGCIGVDGKRKDKGRRKRGGMKNVSKKGIGDG